MENVNIPDDCQQITPYLVVNNAAGLIDFTKKVFDAIEMSRHMRDERLIMHAQIRIGTGDIMLADSTPDYPVQNAGLFIYVDDCDRRFQLALDTGATPITPPADQNYGRSCGVKDPFGNTWWITSV